MHRSFARAAAFALSVAIPATSVAQGPAPQLSSYEQLQVFSGVLSQIRVNYVDSVNFGHLVRAAIEGMLGSLDPHSRYVSRQDFELRSAYENGQLAGAGLALDDADGAVIVLGVDPKGPAAKAGVQAGDRLRSMNDSVLAGVPASALEVRLLGEKGTRIRLGFERGPRIDPDTFAVTIRRAPIDSRVVPPPRLAAPGVGYVRLHMFTPPSGREVRDAVKRVKGMGAERLILDLRGNGGGSVAAMIEIASLFLPARAEIFHTEARTAQGRDTVSTSGGGDFAELPLILLLDDGSASASEMLAGTLQDHDRAVVVGRRSFGKALMQSPLPLPAGDVVWLTTARVVTPSGRVIQRRYAGVGIDQYRALGGVSGAADDTTKVFHTRRGRPVRGGGGIVPDVPRIAPDLPVWFSVAVDSGFFTAAADSVAATLPATPAGLAAWAGDSLRWESALVEPFLARVQRRLGVRTEVTPAVRARIARNLALRTVEVRWGADAEADFLLRHDPDVTLAVATFPRLQQILDGPAR